MHPVTYTPALKAPRLLKLALCILQSHVVRHTGYIAEVFLVVAFIIYVAPVFPSKLLLFAS